MKEGPDPTEYTSFKDARKACTKDKNCKLFYDLQSKNSTFVLCGTSTTEPSHFERSTVFMKCINAIDKLDFVCNQNLTKLLK